MMEALAEKVSGLRSVREIRYDKRANPAGRLHKPFCAAISAASAVSAWKAKLQRRDLLRTKHSNDGGEKCL
ncbi:hypothetical protein [Burkholderia sp. YR290]|jgi:hypothetical protein|uniref:hypothetical protein n=1 Tax=Paraburkholderia sp. SIMBA_054 TaxID=3085795 RepID=UPI00118544C0